MRNSTSTCYGILHFGYDAADSLGINSGGKPVYTLVSSTIAKCNCRRGSPVWQSGGATERQGGCYGGTTVDVASLAASSRRVIKAHPNAATPWEKMSTTEIAESIA